MNASLERIWQIEDVGEMVAALSGYIEEKADYGENMSTLSAPERTFYITQGLEMEVNNGGFFQYFWNSAGNFCNEVVAAFEAIGAMHTAALCQKAIDACGQPLPADRNERQEILDELEEDDDFLDLLSECDDEFYEYADNLNALNHAYIMQHKSNFN